MKKLELYKAFLNSKRPIQKSILSRIENTLRNDFIYNSNAIEGNTLTRQETEVILEYGVTVKGKPLKDHLEVKGQEYAINFLNNIIKENETLSIRLIKEFHSLVLAPVDPEIAGQFKKFKNKIVGSNFETSDPIFVKEDLEKLLENYFSSNEKHDIAENMAEIWGLNKIADNFNILLFPASFLPTNIIHFLKFLKFFTEKRCNMTNLLNRIFFTVDLL